MINPNISYARDVLAFCANHFAGKDKAVTKKFIEIVNQLAIDDFDLFTYVMNCVCIVADNYRDEYILNGMTIELDEIWKNIISTGVKKDICIKCYYEDSAKHILAKRDEISKYKCKYKSFKHKYS